MTPDHTRMIKSHASHFLSAILEHGYVDLSEKKTTTNNKVWSRAVNQQLPNNGLSEVTGIVSDTVFRNTVNDRRMVTPAKEKKEARIE